MMKTLISLNEASNSRQRAWWEVRGALRSALVLVTAIAIAMFLEPNLRTAARVTLLSPATEIAQVLFAWEGWLPLGVALLAGVVAMFALRRCRGLAMLRVNGSVGAES